MKASAPWLVAIAWAYLLNPSSSQPLRSHAPPQTPENFQVIIETDLDQGKACPVVINVSRGLAPECADRFWKMSTAHPVLYQDSAFYLASPSKWVEFGLSTRGLQNDQFRSPMVVEGRQGQVEEGAVAFATNDNKTVTSPRVLIHLAPSDHPDHMVFGKVVSGLDVARRIHVPNLDVSMAETISHYSVHGNSWIMSKDPKVNFIKSVAVAFPGGPRVEINPCFDESLVEKIIRTLEMEVEETAKKVGLPVGTVLLIMLGTLLVAAFLIYCAVSCRRRRRARRIGRYSRELADSEGVEMVYDDDEMEDPNDSSYRLRGDGD